MSNDQEFKLCFVYFDYSPLAEVHQRRYKVFFTTLPEVRDQWGDDWDDVPYEDNAGTPYAPCWHNNKKYINTQRAGASKGELCTCPSCQKDYDLTTGEGKWKILILTIDSPVDLMLPQDVSSVSAEKINSGYMPWVGIMKEDGKYEYMFAGAILPEFKHKMKEWGCKIISEELLD